MAEDVAASVGYGGEFWLHNGTALYELREVTGFDAPGSTSREQIEMTHLKSPDWRRQYISTWKEDQDIELTLNSRPRSDTDLLLDGANEAGDERAFTAVIPEDGEPAHQIEGVCRVISYSRGRVEAGALMQATATIRIVSTESIAAYVAPTP